MGISPSCIHRHNPYHSIVNLDHDHSGALFYKHNCKFLDHTENFLFADSPTRLLDFVVNIHTGIDLDSRIVSSNKSQQSENIDKHNQGVHPPVLTFLYMNHWVENGSNPLEPWLHPLVCIQGYLHHSNLNSDSQLHMMEK